MPKNKHSHRKAQNDAMRRMVPVILLGVLSVVGSFSMGVRSAGDVQPIDALEAQEIAVIEGDMNGDERIDARDVLAALDIVLETVEPTPAQLQADPTPDGRITLEDARRIAALASR